MRVLDAHQGAALGLAVRVDRSHTVEGGRTAYRSRAVPDSARRTPSRHRSDGCRRPGPAPQHLVGKRLPQTGRRSSQTDTLLDGTTTASVAKQAKAPRWSHSSSVSVNSPFRAVAHGCHLRLGRCLPHKVVCEVSSFRLAMGRRRPCREVRGLSCCSP
jgi:hypothetical protein